MDPMVELFSQGEDEQDLGSVSVLRILRLLRLARTARALKLMTAFRELLLILIGMANAMRTIGWVMLIFCIVLYCCSIFTTQIIGNSTHLYPGSMQVDQDSEEYTFITTLNFNPLLFFGTIPRSMFTLFQACILSEFREHSRAVFERQPAMILFYLA